MEGGGSPPEGVTPLSLRLAGTIPPEFPLAMAAAPPSASLSASPGSTRAGRAGDELARWSAEMVSEWLDDSFGDLDLSRRALEAGVDGAQLGAGMAGGRELLDDELARTLQLTEDAVLRAKISARLRKLEARQRGRLRVKVGEAMRSTFLRETLSPKAAAAGASQAAAAPCAEQERQLEQLDGVSIGGKQGRLRVFASTLQWTPSDESRVTMIPLHSIEQTATSPRAVGGGIFGFGIGSAYRIEASVKKRNQESFLLVMEFDSKEDRNTCLRHMQLSVADQAEQYRLASAGAMPLPHVDPWMEHGLGQPAKAATTQPLVLPSQLVFVADMRIADRLIGSHAAYVVRATAAGATTRTWQVTKSVADLKHLRERLSAASGGPSSSSSLSGALAANAFPRGGGSPQHERRELQRWANGVLEALIWNGGGQHVLTGAEAGVLRAELAPTAVYPSVQSVTEHLARFWAADEGAAGSAVDDSVAAVEMVLPALPKGVNCALLDSLGGGPLKDGWLWLESKGLGGATWHRRWFVLWPSEPHPHHGHLLFYFTDRKASEAEGSIQLVAPVVKQPQTARPDHYSMRLNADTIVSVHHHSSLDGAAAAGGISDACSTTLRVTSRKFILGTIDTPDGHGGEQRMREWVAALRTAGPRWRHASARAAPDCSGWLLCRKQSKLGLVTWPRRWCELRGTDLTTFEEQGDLRSGLINLSEFTLYKPVMPNAHRPLELLMLRNPTEKDGPTPVKKRDLKRRSSAQRMQTGTQKQLFYCFCGPDESVFSAFELALGKVMTLASAQQMRVLPSVVGAWALTRRAHGESLATGAVSRVGLDDFDIQRLLGEGAFGKVWLTRPKDELMSQGADGSSAHTVHPPWLALKVMSKQRVLAEKQSEHMQQERKLLQRCDHPFVIALHFAFQTPSSLVLVLEFCRGGDLFETMQAMPAGSRYFAEAEAHFICAELVLALSYLHSLDIVFRDLKPENVLFDSDGHVRLTDFGLAKTLSRPVCSRGGAPMRETVCGTPLYMSPEGVRNHQATERELRAGPAAAAAAMELLAADGRPPVLPGLANDWWMLGILTFELLTGHAPFDGDGIESLQDRILHQELQFPTPIGEEGTSEHAPLPSQPAQAFVSELLIKDPETRLGAVSSGAVQEHGWFTGLDWNALARKELEPPCKPRPDADPLAHFPVSTMADIGCCRVVLHADSAHSGSTGTGTHDCYRFRRVFSRTCQGASWRLGVLASFCQKLHCTS
jgi:serine/threonine protein kinase